ncbi:hypothetical protein PENARI_c066G11816 [Penicillium arizonense]|uniref:Uncharacterized protein n=1 Tax=Penicillium arizonense TaxID=1835702 RepID=A0A1F5L1L1_PENAI|nr:hypothetical protein PENARI_c066G11816 [Penicillium arizonense]OGE47094.1 hypothetical protein PENARI_c066G11816 [Penicillium arizonense]
MGLVKFQHKNQFTFLSLPQEPEIANVRVAQAYEKDASKAAGFREGGSLYKYRKGAAANSRHPDEHSHNIIRGYRKGGTFAYYVSVRDDTQSAFMKTPARDALLKLASNASLTLDASAPQALTDSQKHGLEKNPELAKLKQASKQASKALREELIAAFHQLKKANGSTRYNELLNKIIVASQSNLNRKPPIYNQKEWFLLNLSSRTEI